MATMIRVEFTDGTLREYMDCELSFGHRYTQVIGIVGVGAYSPTPQGSALPADLRVLIPLASVKVISMWTVRRKGGKDHA